MAGEIIARVERRRRWTSEQKLKILTEALRPGVAVSAVADRNGICRSQLYAWKRLAQRGGIPGISLNESEKRLFAPVRIEPVPPLPTPALAAPTAQRRGAIEIALRNGRIVRVEEGIEPIGLARLPTCRSAKHDNITPCSTRVHPKPLLSAVFGFCSMGQEGGRRFPHGMPDAIHARNLVFVGVLS
jgi:transposase